MNDSTRYPSSCEHSRQTFGEFVRQKRLERGLTRAAVAYALGWSVAYVSDIERGSRAAPPDMARIATWAELIGADEHEVRLLAYRERYPELAEAERQRDTLGSAIHDALMIMDHNSDGRTRAEVIATVVRMLNDALEAAG